MNIRRIEAGDRRLWSDFVVNSNNGTIFHTPEFIDYHPEGRFNNHHLLITEGTRSKVVAIIPGALAQQDDGIWFQSYPGASYGGPVFRDEIGLRKIENMLDKLISYGRANEWKGIVITPPPIIYYKHQHNYLEFALLKRGFGYAKRELTAVIDLLQLGDELTQGFRSSALRGVRKAKKNGVVVEENSDFSLFYPVLERNLQQRHGVIPAHTLEELESLPKLVGKNSIRQFIAKKDGEVLGGMIMFNCNSRVTLAFYIAHDQEYQSLRPVNPVYLEVIRWAKMNGYHYLDLGTFTLQNEVNYGLCRFKESFSAKGVFRNTMSGIIS